MTARGRNDRFARQFPEDVSNLSSASAHLASLDGRVDASLSDARHAVDALRAGLPATDPAIGLQRLETGDAFAKQGRIDLALRVFGDLAAAARKAGNRTVEGQALFRTAVLYAAIASTQPIYRERAQQATARIERTTDPEMAPFRDGTAIMKTRLAALEGHTDAVDAALKTMHAAPADQPILIHEPFFALQQPDAASFGGIARGDSAPQWADFGFWIAPDGRVHDVDVLRQSAVPPGAWVAQVAKTMAGRRYVPLALDADSPGVFRVERYSMVYDFQASTRSRIAERTPVGRLEKIDLTAIRSQAVPRPPDMAPRPAVKPTG